MARTHVILDDEVLAAIDGKVGQRGRSRFLEEAAKEKLERIDLEAAIRNGSGILKMSTTATGETRSRSKNG